jgi:hypothetical protein
LSIRATDGIVEKSLLSLVELSLKLPQECSAFASSYEEAIINLGESIISGPSVATSFFVNQEAYRSGLEARQLFTLSTLARCLRNMKAMLSEKIVDWIRTHISSPSPKSVRIGTNSVLSFIIWR